MTSRSLHSFTTRSLARRKADTSINMHLPHPKTTCPYMSGSQHPTWSTPTLLRLEAGCHVPDHRPSGEKSPTTSGLSGPEPWQVVQWLCKHVGMQANYQAKLENKQFESETKTFVMHPSCKLQKPFESETRTCMDALYLQKHFEVTPEHVWMWLLLHEWVCATCKTILQVKPEHV